MADKEIQNNVINHARADMAAIPGASHDPPKSPARKIGEGHAAGMARLGAHELTQALQAFPDSNIRPMEEPGVLGNPTPQIVTEQMGDYNAMLNEAAQQKQHSQPTKDRGANEPPNAYGELLKEAAQQAQVGAPAMDKAVSERSNDYNAMLQDAAQSAPAQDRSRSRSR